jgi:DNA-binding transcriptional MocR family regulator
VGDTGQTVLGGVNLGMTWPMDALNPDLSAAIRKLSRRADLAELLAYQPNAGMPRHRRAGAHWIASHGHEVAPESVLVCGGAQHAMTVVFSTLARPGDTVLTEELTYPGARAVVELLGLKAVGVAMDDEGLLPDALDAACRKRRPKLLYCVPSIHNPTTATQSTERREAIVRVAREHGIALVEDAIHHRLLAPSSAPPLLASLAPERTYLIASPSKVVAGGLRVAFLSAPRHAVEELAHGLWATTWMVPPLAAEIMSTWIEDGTADETVARKRAEATARNVLLRDAVAGTQGVLHASPSGYHAWLDLPPAWPDASVFVAQAHRRGVALTDSGAFHVGGGVPPAAIRVSLSAPASRGTLADGLDKLAGALMARPGLERPVV